MLLAAAAVSLVAASLSSGVALAAKGPNTIIDPGSPPSLTTSTSATFTFHSTVNPATFSCKLDSGASGLCTSPKIYSVAQGTHTFSVFATANGTSDKSPATYTWTVDTTAPSTPTNLAATTPTATSVVLT